MDLPKETPGQKPDPNEPLFRLQKLMQGDVVRWLRCGAEIERRKELLGSHAAESVLHDAEQGWI